MRAAAALILVASTMLAAGAALAQQPQPWEMTLQPAATDVMSSIRWFADYTLIIVGLITALVLALILICIYRFNERANPTPDKTSHNTLLEVAWTVLPVLILVAIAVPSFQLLYYEENIPEADLTIKATGMQWFWQYEYMDEAHEGIQLTSLMLDDDQRAELLQKHELREAQAPRLLAADYQMVVPVGKVVRLEVTSGDVNHSFAMPAFGVKVDAIPGRLNQTWFNVERPGTYYGQCSELCGRLHAFMPIVVRAVDDERFEEWAAAAKNSTSDAQDLIFKWDAEDNEAEVIRTSAAQ